MVDAISNGKQRKACVLNKLPGVLTYKGTTLTDVNNKGILTQLSCDSNHRKSTAPLKLFGNDNSEDISGFACLSADVYDN